MAPLPQAMVSFASRTVPGGPEPSAGTAERIFRVSPPRVENVPGQGVKARIRRSISVALCVQSIRPSSRVSLGA